MSIERLALGAERQRAAGLRRSSCWEVEDLLVAKPSRAPPVAARNSARGVVSCRADSNAGSEGTNRVIKTIARDANGFRNPGNQRLRTRCTTTRRARGHLDAR